MIILAVMQSALATIITIICRTHIDPLNGKAAVAFAIKNFRYFGLPIELIFLAFMNTTLALEIWIFGKYGLIAGGFASVASFSGMWGSLFTWKSVFSWKNKEISTRVRIKRKKLFKEILKNLFPYNIYYHTHTTGCAGTCACKKESTSKKPSESQVNSRQISTTEV